MTDTFQPALLRELREVAEATALEAARLVREHSEGPVTVADRKSSEVDVVTAADKASEELLARRLAERRPDDGFFGEEGAGVTPAAG
jgi:myo-inositol-1(or 4)-monophosphatase